MKEYSGSNMQMVVEKTKSGGDILTWASKNYSVFRKTNMSDNTRGERNDD